MMLARNYAEAGRALRAWMAAENVSGGVLALQLGCCREHISNLRQGKSAPGRTLAIQIERVTRGAVPAHAWDEVARSVGRSVARRPRKERRMNKRALRGEETIELLPDASEQERLAALAREAWPNRDIEVVASSNSVHVSERGSGHVLLHVEHEHAREVLSMLAGDVSSPSVQYAFAAVERMVRARMRRTGLDVIGFRDDGIHLWDEDGKRGTGPSLLEALLNLDRRRGET